LIVWKPIYLNKIWHSPSTPAREAANMSRNIRKCSASEEAISVSYNRCY
jgi:hypothetical protein